MAITAIQVTQNNFNGNSDLLAVHSPLVFLATATFTGDAPDILYCYVYDELDTELGKFRCIPYRDILTTQREFAFVADKILKVLMDELEDYVQTGGSLIVAENATKLFKIKFSDDSVDSSTLEFIAIHAAFQFGESENAIDIYNNVPTTYIGVEGLPVYLYYYNSDETNVIDSEPGGLSGEALLDYDDDDFLDYNDALFTTYVIS